MIERMPAQSFHLSTILQDELTARGWTLGDLAYRMGPESEYGINRLKLDLIWSVHDVRCFAGDSTLGKISTALGVPFEYLKNLESAWHKWMKYHKLDRQIPPREVTDEVNRQSPPNLLNDNHYKPKQED